GNISAVNFDQFDPFTIEAWIQTTGTGLQTIAGQQEDAGGGTGYRIFLQDSLFRMSLNNTSGSDQLAVNADGSSINDGQWHHVAVTHDGSGTAAGIGLFIDGEKYPNLIVQDNLTSSTVSAANFSIGSRNGVQHYFNGLIEQVRVWDIDRSAEEIYTNADSSIASDPNLILAFEFDQDSAAAIDAIGGNDGALNGDANYVSSTAFDNDIFAPLFTSGYPFVDDITENDFQINSNANETGLLGVAVYADGTPTPTSDDVVNGTGAITFASALSESAITRIGGSLNPGTDYDVYFVLEDLIGNRQHIPTIVDVTTSAASNLALEFDGSAQYVAVPDAPQFDLDSDWTIEAWIKTPSTGQQNIVGQIAGTTGYSFFKIGGTLYLQYYSSGGFQNGGTSLSVAAGIDDDQWHHVAVSQNGSNGKIYVDGSPVLDVNVLLPIDETTDEVRIGYDEFVGAFTGSIDEVRFWDYQRSDSEIFDHHDSKLFGSESGLVAYYPFDDGSPSTIATDATGNGNDGNLTSMDENTDWVVGPALSPAISAPQNALNFDGTDDYIEVPDNPTLDITTEVTVSAWLRIDGNTGSIQNAVRKNDNYLLGWIPADYSRFEAQVFVGSQWESIQSTLTPTDLENEWHHFAMTYDGSTLSLYVDGILDNQVPLSGTMNVTADPLHLGSVSFA
ncbi:MAG: LamG domain-containing protein, partial [Lentilitoribacter sp.]